MSAPTISPRLITFDLLLESCATVVFTVAPAAIANELAIDVSEHLIISSLPNVPFPILITLSGMSYSIPPLSLRFSNAFLPIFATPMPNLTALKFGDDNVFV